jgi:membrane-bound serine protease (ClpP class)
MSNAAALRRGRRSVGAAGLLLVGLLGSLGSGGVAAAQSAPDETVVRLQLHGVVDPFVADYLERGIADAATAGDAAVLIQIDTPGGLDSSMRQVTEAILAARIPVIGYVAPSGARAASAGAFVLMATPIAAMAPGTNVGAATPVGINGATGSDKAVQDAAAYMRSLAEHQGRDADVAASFVTDAVSISAEQALTDGVIEYVAPSAEDLLKAVDGQQVEIGGTSVTLHTAGDVIVDQDLGGFVGFLHGLLDPNLAFIFFWLGLALIVLELLVPGHIFSGTVGTILLVLAVVSFGLLPVRILGVALLLGAAVAFIVEASQPGLGVWGVLGLVFLVLGGWFLYDRAGGVGVSAWVLALVAILIGAFFGLVVAKARKLRDLPPPQGPEAIVGQEGVALGTGLDPSGVVRINAEQWQAVTAGRRIPAGAKIRATAIDGFTLTVEPVDAEGPREAIHRSEPTPVSDATAPAPAEERGTT